MEILFGAIQEASTYVNVLYLEFKYSMSTKLIIKDDTYNIRMF